MIFILFLLALGTIVCLLVTYLLALGLLEGNHVLWSLVSVPLGLFSLTMHTFYFIGSGKEMKTFLDRRKVDQSVRQEFALKTRQFKKKVFPGLTLAIVFLMATFVAGGMADVGMAPPDLHLILASLALPTTTAALVVAHAVIRQNVILLQRVFSSLKD